MLCSNFNHKNKNKTKYKNIKKLKRYRQHYVAYSTFDYKKNNFLTAETFPREIKIQKYYVNHVRKRGDKLYRHSFTVYIKKMKTKEKEMLYPPQWINL